MESLPELAAAVASGILAHAHGSGLLSHGLIPAWKVVGIALVDGSEMAPATPLACSHASCSGENDGEAISSDSSACSLQGRDQKAPTGISLSGKLSLLLELRAYACTGLGAKYASGRVTPPTLVATRSCFLR